MKRFLILCGVLMVLMASLSFAATLTTQWKNATANSGSWANPENAYWDGVNYSSETAKNDVHEWYNYNFTEIQGAESIDAVEIRADAWRVGGGVGDVTDLSVSCDGGGTWSDQYSVGDTTSETTYIWDITNLGQGACSTPPTISELDDTNFRIEADAHASGGSPSEWRLDWIPVRVNYTRTLAATQYSANVTVFNTRDTADETDDYYVGGCALESGKNFGSQEELNSGNPIAELNISPDTAYRMIITVSADNNDRWDFSSDGVGQTFLTVLGANKYVNYSDAVAADDELLVTSNLFANEGNVNDDIVEAIHSDGSWRYNDSECSTLDGCCEFGDLNSTNDPDSELHFDWAEDNEDLYNMEQCLGDNADPSEYVYFITYFEPDDDWSSGDEINFNFTVKGEGIGLAESDDLLLNFTLNLTGGVPPTVGFTITLPGQSGVDSEAAGNATTGIEFNTSMGTNVSVDPCVKVVGSPCQTTSTPIFNFTNVGTATLNYSVSINASLPASITLYCDTDSNPAGNTTITTTEWLVNASVPQNYYTNLWCWADFTGSHTNENTTRRFFNNGTTQ